MKRVVVTGLGLLTSLGKDVKSSWDNLLECKSGINIIKTFDTSDLPCKIAGHISSNTNDEFYFDLNKFFDNKHLKRNDRFILYGLYAAEQAIKDSGIDNLNEEQKYERA